MKIIPFQIPKTGNAAIRVQIDRLPHLYNHLHQHPEIQLTLICESEGLLIAGDYLGRFKAGDVFVIGSNQPHVFRNDAAYFKGKKQALAITLFFDETTLGAGFWHSPELKSFQNFFRNSQGGYQVSGKKQIQLKEKLLAISTSEGIEKVLVFIEILKLLAGKKEMTGLSAITHQRSIKAFDGSRLNTILEYSFKESHRVIQLDEIAGIANLTKEAFCKYFKTRTGRTYINFLNEIRVNNACKLLSETDLPIATIGYQTGFNNLSNFNRIFKYITGKTPKESRQQQTLIRSI